MIRTSILFGLWAAICMLVAIAGFFLIMDFAGSPASSWKLSNIGRGTVKPIVFLSLFALPAGVIASLGWMLFHRGGRQPRWWGYGSMAIAIVVVGNYVILGALALGFWGDTPREWLKVVSMELLFHGWLSVPMALIGTALFVLWQRRRVAGA